MNPVDILGYTATAILAFAYIPQAIQAWRTKLVRDISLKTFVILSTASILWIIYGYLKSDWPIMVVNVMLIAVQTSIVICKLKYSKQITDNG